jgi:hypothetical protein
MQALYDQLGLDEFDNVRSKIESYLSRHADYRTNRYSLTPDQKQEVESRWGDVIHRYGYESMAVTD